jgi:CubicO group peptidase (beta-lactamase class C family)
LRPDELARVSDMHRNPNSSFFKLAADPSTPLGRAFRSAPSFGYFQNCPEIRQREVPSFGGHGNARAVARIYAALAGDGSIDGVRILSAPAVQRAAQLWATASCTTTNTAPMGANMAAFGHTGTGGAFAWCDRDRNLAFAYCTNFQRAEAGIGPRGAAVSVAAGNGKASSAAFDRPPSLIGVPYGGGRRRSARRR